MLVYHSKRGAGTITQACRKLQQKNPPHLASIFVEFIPGEPEEVSRTFLTYPDVYEILELWMEAAVYFTGEDEEKIPALKRARTLTGLYLNEMRKDCV